MPDRYPGYDVTAKRRGQSWNQITRTVIDRRLAVPGAPRFFSAEEFACLAAIAGRIVPQPLSRPPIPVAALIDQRLHEDRGDGYRAEAMPRPREAWRRGLAGLEAEAMAAFGEIFAALPGDHQDGLLRRAEAGALSAAAWGGMPVRIFFKQRLLSDIMRAYWSHPTAWSEIGWGGPASPRGYVRLGYDERDPWEAVEAGSDPPPGARIFMSSDPLKAPRGSGGRAPDVFRRGGFVPMRQYAETEAVDFLIVGTGAGGATLGCCLAEAGFSVVALDAGPWFRPLEDFASDEEEQSKLYWTDDRITAGANPVQLGANNSGKSVGGSTVHFAMVSLRFRPEWFKSRSLLGYGADWPLDWREMWHYYAEVEQALKISGPVTYPWGPRRPRYPYRAHPLNAAALALAEGCAALGIGWTETPLATLSAPRGLAHPCVYRGFCTSGCSTNAKQSALVTWIPRAVAAGAEIRDLAMAGRIVLDAAGRASGVEYFRDGAWRFQRARNVVVAGYAVETPRLLLNSANARYPQGLANRSGLVGKYFTVQANQAVWGISEREIRAYKGPPSLALTEHWNYDDGKDFFGGYCYMSQGPLPQSWGNIQANSHGLWGERLMAEMERYNHQVGLKIVGEMMPQEQNQVTLAEDKDQYGLPVARVEYSWCDNDKRLIAHSLDFMTQALAAIGTREIWQETDDTCHMNGTARMGDDPRTSVVNADCRSWDINNLWVCDGSVFPTVGGVNPSLTIQAIACRTADRIKSMAARGEL